MVFCWQSDYQQSQLLSHHTTLEENTAENFGIPVPLTARPEVNYVIAAVEFAVSMFAWKTLRLPKDLRLGQATSMLRTSKS